MKESAKSIGVARLAPPDLRRTCPRLCHPSGGELEQIQFLLGHVSVHTTERYLGCKQRIRSTVNDRIDSSRILELGVRLWKGCRSHVHNPQFALWMCRSAIVVQLENRLVDARSAIAALA